MAKKQENNGLIRDFDLKQSSTRRLYFSVLGLGFIVAFASIAPLIWLVLSGFKTLPEFVNEPTILPKAYDFVTKAPEPVIPVITDIDLSIYFTDPVDTAPVDTESVDAELADTDLEDGELEDDEEAYEPWVPPVYDAPVRIVRDRYFETWSQLRFPLYYRNSLMVVIGSVISAIFFNGLLGYALSKVQPKGWQIVFALVMWSLLIPSTTSIVPLFVNISRLHLTGSFIPLWLAIGANAFFVVLFKNFFDEIPQSLIEAAKLDGAKDFTIFLRIAVPLSKAIIMVIVLYAVNAAWSDFLLPYLTLRGTSLETVMVRLFQFRNGRYSDIQIIQAVIFSLVPPIVLFFFFQKQITGIALRSGVNK